MYEPPDYVLRGSFRKFYGNIRAIPRSDLLRRLRHTPEFMYYADQMVERALARGILRPVEPSAADAPRPADSEWLEFVNDGPNSFDDQFQGIFPRPS